MQNTISAKWPGLLATIVDMAQFYDLTCVLHLRDTTAEISRVKVKAKVVKVKAKVVKVKAKVTGQSHIRLCTLGCAS